MLVCSVSYCKETDLGFVSKFSTPRVSTCDFLLLEVCLFIFIASCDSKWHWLRRQIRHGCGSRLLLIVYVFAVLGLIELSCSQSHYFYPLGLTVWYPWAWHIPASPICFNMAIYKIIRRKCGPKENQEGVDQKRMEEKI